MDIIESSQSTGKSFFNHVFSTSEEGKAELINVVQYSTLGIIPVVVLNKLIQRFIPEADPEKSSLEIIFEIILQLIFMFCGMVLIHRIITYVPTYSGFKYEPLILTNAMLAFLVIVLSVQTKMGIKVNILTDRLGDLWNGTNPAAKKRVGGGRSSIAAPGSLLNTHNPSQADYLDNNGQSDMFPPAPSVTKKPSSSYDLMMRGNPAPSFEPAPANSVLSFK